MKKVVLTAVTALSFAGLFGISSINAQASSTTPRAIRGTFYSYAGHNSWNRLTIKAHSAKLSGPGYGKNGDLISPSGHQGHHLNYKGYNKSHGVRFFTLQNDLKYSAESAFPEDGMGLTYRNINGKRYKVIRAYQMGSWDFIKGHKFHNAFAKN